MLGAPSSPLTSCFLPHVVLASRFVYFPHRCGGLIYDTDACYPQLGDIAGPLNGKMHANRKFIFDHFPREPWPRKTEIIFEVQPPTISATASRKQLCVLAC